MNTLILPARRALADPAGPYVVSDRRADGTPRELARFNDPDAAIDYVNALRDAGALVEVRLIPTAGGDDAQP